MIYKLLDANKEVITYVEPRNVLHIEPTNFGIKVYLIDLEEAIVCNEIVMISQLVMIDELSK